MRVFVTGGTGFIGYPLTRSLIARGWDVVALVRNPDRPQSRAVAKLGAHCLAGDVTDRESMRAGMTAADLVVHNAGWYELGVTRPARRLMRATNVTGTDNVLGLALELGVPRSVYVSSVAYYGGSGPVARDETYRRQAPCRSYYEQTKVAAHGVAGCYQQRGLPLIVVCPANVAGPNDHSVLGYYLRMYLNRVMAPVGFSPDMIMSTAHVDDVAEGIALAAEKARIGETYILAGDAMSVRQTFDLWSTAPGAFKVRWYLPFWLARMVYAPLGPVLRLADLPAFISGETIRASGESYCFSGAKAVRELGWTHRPAPAMWREVISREVELLAARKGRSLAWRLKPVEAID